MANIVSGISYVDVYNNVNVHGFDPAISYDGTYIIFDSSSSALPGYTSTGAGHVYVKNMLTGSVTRVDPAISDPVFGDVGYAGFATALSKDGHFVAFEEGRDNTWRVTDWTTGNRYNLGSASVSSYVYDTEISLSSTGRYAAFVQSNSSTGYSDIYRTDLTTNTKTLVTVALNGGSADYYSSSASVSSDGRYVAFSSSADNLDPLRSSYAASHPGSSGALGTAAFVRDMVTGTTTLLHAPGAYQYGSGDSPVITPDGHYVVYQGDDQIWRYDVTNGSYALASASATGAPAANIYGNETTFASISDDGRWVTFQSRSNNLDPAHDSSTGLADDIFVKDMVTGQIQLLSTSSSQPGQDFQGKGESSNNAHISGDGHYILFESYGHLAGSHTSQTGSQDGSNFVMTLNPLWVPPPVPDLSSTNFTFDGTTASFGVSDIGGGSAQPSTAGVYLSSDSSVTTADTLIGSVSVGGLAAGQTMAVNTSTLTLPSVGGTYYLGVIANYNGSTTESDTTNNTSNVLTIQLGTANGETMTGGSGDDIIVAQGGNDTINGGAGNDTINGGAGEDTVDYSSAASAVTVNLAANTASGGAGNDRILQVEDIIGSNFADTLIGDSNANVINGGASADTMNGGSGDDVYIVDNSGDIVQELPGGGRDLVQSSATYALPNEVDNLTLTGSGNINGTGNALDNVFTGNSGNNAFVGGAGNDTYIVQNAGDSILENAGEGTDSVQSSVTWVLSGNIENLTLTGSSAINGTGNALDNVLTGNNGANVLTGGAGNDTYIVGTGDTTAESANEGTDTVQSSLSWTLAANVENLTLTGSGNISGTGNSSDNVIIGNSGINVLTGGAGNDTYGVFNTASTVVENAGGGTDTIGSTVSYTLPANVEKLFLFGNTPISATGNAGDNEIRGNFGHNDLFGGGGNDSFEGGAGRDTLHLTGNRADYTIVNSGDLRIFTGGGTTETVHGVEKVVFADGVLTLRDVFMHFGDANGDGKDDLLWRNLDGSAAIWNMNGATVTGGGIVGPNNIPLEWSLAGTGDFNGDGRADDMVWHHADGSTAIWTVSGSSLMGGGIVGPVIPAEWSLAGTGDFNGDGKDDLLWHNQDGSVAIWLINNLSLVGGAVVGNAPLSWTIAGTGDFNGDHKADILWRNTDGSVAVWLMNGTGVAGGAVVGPPVPNDWKISGTGDFNGDGKDDILWRNNNGSVAVWLMNGVNSVGGGIVGAPNVPKEWTIAGTGDFNGDHKDDIAWSNDNGQVAVWFLNGSNVLGGGIAGSAPTDWTII